MRPFKPGRRLVGLGLGACVLLGVADGFVQSPAVSALLARTVLPELAARAGQSLRVDSLHAQLLPPGLHVENLALADLEGSQDPWLRLQDAEIILRPWPSAHGNLNVQRLTARGLTFAWDRLPQASNPATAAAAATTHPKRLLPLDVHHAAFTELEAHGTAFGQRFAAQGGSLVLDHSLREGRQVWAHLERLGAQASGPLPAALVRALGALLRNGAAPPQSRAVHLEAQLQGHIAGSLDALPRLLVRSLDARFAGIAARLLAHGAYDTKLAWGGGASGSAAEAALHAEVDTTLELGDLAQLLPLSLPMRGQLRSHTVVQSLPDAHSATWPLDVHGDAAITALQVRDAKVGTVHADFELRPGILRLAALRLDMAEQGFITASAEVDLQRLGLPMRLAARLHDTGLAHLLQAVGLGHTRLQARLAGDLRGSGTMHPLDLHLRPALEARGMQLSRAGKAAASDAATPLCALPFTHIVGSARVRHAQLDLDELLLSGASGSVQLLGSLGAADGYAVQAHSDAFDLTGISPLAGVPLGGRATLQAQLRGPLPAPQLRGTLQVKDFLFFGHPLGSTAAQVDWHPQGLTFAQLQAGGQGNKAPVQGSVALIFAGGHTELRTVLHAHGLPLTTLLSAWAPALRPATDLQAPLQGSLLLSGPLPRLTGRLRLQAQEVILKDEPLGALQLQLTFLDGRSAGSLRLHSPATELQVSVQQEASGELAINADMAQVPLRLLDLLAPQAQAEGRARGHLHLGGQAAALHGELNVVGDDVQLAGFTLGRLTLTGEAQAGVLQLRGELLPQPNDGSPLPFTAEVGLRSASLPTRLHARLERFTWTALSDRISRLLRFSLNGELQASGSLRDMASWRAQLQLQSARLGERSLQLQLLSPTTLRYSAGTLSLARAELGGPHLHGRLGGTWGGAERWRSAASLAAMRPLSRRSWAPPAAPPAPGRCTCSSAAAAPCRAFWAAPSCTGAPCSLRPWGRASTACSLPCVSLSAAWSSRRAGRAAAAAAFA